MSWEESVRQMLEQAIQMQVKIYSVSPVGGGSINDTFRVETSSGIYFVKKNSASRYPAMFEKEAKGLQVLADAGEITVPEVIAFGESDDDAFLILEFIQSGARPASFWDDFARQLANLHRHSSGSFGLDHDNYIGSLVQYNRQHKTWADFFREERLEVQLRLAIDNHKMGKETMMAFGRFYNKLNEIFPPEPPALLHGDLWGGNYMVDEKGSPLVIDPAVYYGHREMDLGMSQLFGGFDVRFYEAYQRYFPLEKGWQQRLDYCNLYPLMVHVNLFGGSYTGSVKAILKVF